MIELQKNEIPKPGTNPAAASITSFVNTVENGGNSFKFNDISLSGLAGLNDTTVTFTITDTSGGISSSTGFWTGFDDVTITGTVAAVPEPTTTALLGLGGLALILRRRK